MLCIPSEKTVQARFARVHTWPLLKATCFEQL
jgi:hypothetical protein